MPKPIARSKTKKAVAKRFKVSKRGYVLASRAGRRHLAASKNRKRKRRLKRWGRIDSVEEPRVLRCLPFGRS
ncbi:50S ribosomal protein L35 [Candidatus Methylacidithermus pantelleriae]|uniref:Large ribosomal subunit protein bL35 n=1 Tax=Candidatus Methylacidithermus pantelleriae TaxID=2744239 RepID=A0A8J2FR75_9BACT|nr:50S ribosomal protein L35 [Candidatus Methylacidithermus pantelleriae]CAF0688991.1 50S ribosomal protein L35 [Candidatus Methylacidithermus pantelleriae]